MRRLILNADDFGLTPGVNRAIVEAHRNGLVTSATLMANGGAFDDAVRLAAETPTLEVGCHVVLMDGAPLLAPERVPSLLRDGRLRDDFKSFAAAVVRRRIEPGEIERETTAQIRKLQRAGVTVTHLDTHKHAHMFPRVLRPLLRAAHACGVVGIRNPFAPVKPLAFAHLVRRPRLWTRYSEVKILRPLGINFRAAVADAGMLTTDGSFGVVSTGALDLPLFEAIAGCIPEGTWEFVCHPGYNDADLERVRTRLRATRPLELAVLTSAEARAALTRYDLTRISYADLLAAATLRK